MAYRNTGRHPRRAVLTVLAIVIAVVAVTFMDAYLRGLMEGVIDNFIRLDAGHVHVVPKKALNSHRPLPLDEAMSHVTGLVEAIEQLPEITVAAPRIRFFVLMDKPEGSIPVMGIGLVPSREKKMMRLPELLIEGDYPADSSYDILLSSGLAETLKKRVGDELFFVTKDAYGGLGPGLYKVCGIVETGIGLYDKNTFYAPLPAVNEQLALDDGALEIVCRVKGGIDGSRQAEAQIAGILRERGDKNLAVQSWQEQGYIYTMYRMMGLVNGIMMLLVAVIALTTILNTILMSVMERVREFGALRALGFEKSSIIKLVILETMVLGAFGTVIGVALGMGISLLVAHTGIDLTGALNTVSLPMKPIIYPHPVLGTALKSALFGLLVSLIAAWYPAKKAIKPEPADALRTF